LSFTIGALPIAPTQIGPAGSGADATPVYTFNAVNGATAYDIFLWNVTTATGSITTSTPAQANCPSDAGVCTITQSPPLANGGYAWYVRAENLFGTGPWGPYLAFKIP
jgi:hypothetical protein